MKRIKLSAFIFLFAGSMSGSSQSVFITDISNPGAKVADICRGQQIEEFNHQFEGGLYAQLINNPSFEELKNPIAQWNLVKSGSSDGILNSCEKKLLNDHQEHCLRLSVTSVSSGNVGLSNNGYWGIKLENNKKYKVSFWARSETGYKGIIEARLENNDGTVYAKSQPFIPTSEWKHYTCTLTPKGITKISGNNRFVLYASAEGEVYFDVVTVMPPTWKNRPNGLRPDLAEKLAALKFKYIQFPGGCTAESYTMHTCWNWKNSIGPIEQRSGATRNNWGYKNDLYFGLDEHFQLCEDMGAEPIYTASSGLSERPDSPPYQVCPLDKMQPIIQDILDLLEYCNGSTTSFWGAKRAENGHKDPYNLKYIEIGNENGWNTVSDYIPRYSMIRDSILAHYPDTKIMYNGIIQDNVLSHTYGNLADFVDEHFYWKDLSLLYNKYDSIDPACKKICVAEYASSVKGNGGKVIGNFGDALGDAAFMLGCEKNSERIWWTGYGNYGGFVGHSNFGPCIVWNDAVSSFASPSYYMQKMLFTANQGTYVLPFSHSSSRCFWSASIDKNNGKNDILIKVVNKSDVSEKVRFQLKGVKKVSSKVILTMMTGTPEVENSLEKPENIVPVTSLFKADNNFEHMVPAYSVAVFRMKIVK